MTTPTNEFYGALTNAYQHFNDLLFDGGLPSCLITTSRKKNSMGCFLAKRWGDQQGKVAHELTLNPSYFSAFPLIEVFQTIVHEQTHCWQFEFGKPGRGNYHNKEWANKMVSIGLVPSDTGKPGGKQTGQEMSDYPDPNGRFIKACKALVEPGKFLPWTDRFPAINEIQTASESQPDTDDLKILYLPVSELVPNLHPPEVVEQMAKERRKVKYTCENCSINVWGKPNLNIRCDDCDCLMEGQL